MGDLHNYSSVSSVFIFFVVYLYNLQSVYGQNAAANPGRNVPIGPVISTNTGDLRPALLLSRNSHAYYGFLGIPYASPPIENLRYSPPSEPLHWSGVRNATKYGSTCIQYNIFKEKVEGEEDCLYLNVFTPKLPDETQNRTNEELYTVMVFIHSGAFMFGSASDYDAKYFMDEKVVLVTISYRLGSFGFLSTADDVIQGNMGLKDQVMALKWIRDNIDKFNGDKNRVTIFGESAGGASVHYHILSPMSKGLFHNAISQSGTALCPWAFSRNPKTHTKRLAAMVNCPTGDNHEMVECLKNSNASILASKHKEFFEWNTDPISPFAPSVEVSFNKNGVFLPNSPHFMIKNKEINEVPWIIGVTEEEGLLDAASVLVDRTLTAEINIDWFRIAPLTFDFRSTALEPDAISNHIRIFYFGDKEIGNTTQTNLTNLYSDRYFCHCSRVAALLHKKRNEGMHIYLYYFAHRSATSHINLIGIQTQLGVSEGDELQYLFKLKQFKFNEIRATHKYADFSKKFIKVWLSFANNGKPSTLLGSEWTEIQSEELKGDVSLKYYRIDKNSTMIEDPFIARMNFWDNLPLNEHEDESLLSVYSRSDINIDK